MAFNDEVVKDGQGRAIRVDISFDKFSTVSHRYGDRAGLLDGTNMYSSRVLSLGKITRGFGQNNVSTSASTDIVFDNADGGVDWLTGSANVSYQASARFRVYVVLYTPGATPSFASKQLGEFSLSEWTTQRDSVVVCQLSDDISGVLSQLAPLPTLSDWRGAGDETNNPIAPGMGLPAALSEFSGLQLTFGEGFHRALPHILQEPRSSGPYSGSYVTVPLYVTTSPTAISQDDITGLRVRWIAYSDVTASGQSIGGYSGGENGFNLGPQLMDIPRTRVVHPAFGTLPAEIETIWTVEKSEVITMGSKEYYVVYAMVRDNLGIQTFSAGPGNWDAVDGLGMFQSQGGYPADSVARATANVRVTTQRVLEWYFKGAPLSAITNITDDQHAVDVASDLASYYSNAVVSVDATEAARVKAGVPNAKVSGLIGGLPGVDENHTGTLRDILDSICKSSDCDLFINWSGNLSFSANIFDFTIASQGASSLVSIPESQISGMERWIPVDGERWAPFNRLWIADQSAFPAEDLEPVYFYGGPWDIEFDMIGDAIDVNVRVIDRYIYQSWRPFSQQRSTASSIPTYWRNLSVSPRDMVRFRTNISGLRLELGQFFTLSWTRGPSLNSPYLLSAFQVESISYMPDDDSVEITAIWRDDVMSEKSYILDDETLLVRSKGVLTGSATTFSGDVYVDFGGTINLTTMGVVEGDVLVLRHTGEAADEFEYNQALKVSAVVSSTRLETLYTWASSVAIVNADWYIVRGATTYHTAISDPTNYPSGGDLYGKVTNSSGLYTNSDEGNLLISG